MKHLDTSFLVDVLRESGRRAPGPATLVLETIMDEELRVGVYVICELLAGAELASRPREERQRVHQLCASLAIVYPDERFAAVYARTLASLVRNRQRISSMDLLIATAALVDTAPLVTRNAKDFSWVPGLEVIAY